LYGADERMNIDSGARRRLRQQLGSRTMRRQGTKSNGPHKQPKPRIKLAAAIIAWEKAGSPEVPRRK
jgi:hypothetical protein